MTTTYAEIISIARQILEQLTDSTHRPTSRDDYRVLSELGDTLAMIYRAAGWDWTTMSTAAHSMDDFRNVVTVTDHDRVALALTQLWHPICDDEAELQAA